MSIYIRSAAGISAQDTFNSSFLTEIVKPADNRFTCIEPDYSSIIDVKLIRRMSRIIKMGVAAAMKCLQHAAVEMPDAIIMGTAYGCLQDTEFFLTRMIEYNEELLTPTAFIQSTHNTVGAQIALMLKCHNYNNTFVHRGFSFESALLDAMMLLQENEMNNILVGAADEITGSSHEILSRFGLYKDAAIAGEGAFFFLLSNETPGKNIAQLNAVNTFYKPTGIADIEQHILSFLSSQSVTMADIDLVITGGNGDKKNDEIYNELEASVFVNKQVLNYKHLCGEYPTASSFALWMASAIIKDESIPKALSAPSQLPSNKIKTILIYNHYLLEHHSLFLVTTC